MPRGIYKTDVRIQYSIDKVGVLGLASVLGIVRSPPRRAGHGAGVNFGDSRAPSTCGWLAGSVVCGRLGRSILPGLYMNDMLTAL